MNIQYTYTNNNQKSKRERLIYTFITILILKRLLKKHLHYNFVTGNFSICLIYVYKYRLQVEYLYGIKKSNAMA